MVGHANERPVMNDSLREKFPVGWRRVTEGRTEEHPRQKEKFEQRPEVQNEMVVWRGVVRIPRERGAKWKMRQKEGVGQKGSWWNLK